MRLCLDPSSIDDYRTFLAIKRLPSYRIRGCMATFPDEYAERVLGQCEVAAATVEYLPPDWMFDYQAYVTRLAIYKRKFATFIECGLGKTGILLEFALHALRLLSPSKKVLIVSPLMVIRQTIDEAKRFYPAGYPIEQVRAGCRSLQVSQRATDMEAVAYPLILVASVLVAVAVSKLCTISHERP